MRTKEAITPHDVHDDFDTQLQCEDVYTGEDPDEASALFTPPYVPLDQIEKYLEISRPQGILAAFRNGEWYDFYEEDAVKAHSTLCAGPTNTRLSQFSMPYAYVERHLATLLAAGHKVALVDPATKTTLGQRVICGKCLKHLATDGSKGDYRLTENLQPICAECCAAIQEGAA